MSTQEFNCDICNMTLNCYQQYMQHRTGRKHLYKAKQKGVNPDAPGTAAGAPSQPKPYGASFVPASVSEVDGLLNGKQSQGAPKTVVPFNQGFNSNTLAQIAGQGTSTTSAPVAEKLDPVAEAVRQNMLGTLPVKRKAEVVGVCEPCSLEFNSVDQQQAHLSGKKHAKKMKLSDIAEKQDPVAEAVRQNMLGTLPVKRKVEVVGVCEPCGLEFSSLDQQQAHLSGKKHAKKMKLSDITEKQDPVSEAVSQNMLGTLPVKRKAEVVGVCEPCGLEFNSVDQQQAHLSGKKHAKKVKLSENSNTASFFCSFCNLHVNSIEQMDQHREGTKHKKKVGNAKDVQDEMRLASKLPKMTSENLTAPPPPPPPVNIPPPPAELESMKYADY